MARLVLKTFRKRLLALDYTRSRMETLYTSNEIALRDLHAVYEALFLRAVTGFEGFIEQLFMGILERKIVYAGDRVRLRMRVSSKEALGEILHQGGKHKFLDWIPYERTMDRAKIYLKDGNPFCELVEVDKHIIHKVQCIRNAIAHQSAHASEKFRSVVLANNPLLRNERTPAGFLRSQVAGGQNRFQIYAGELGSIAGKLC